MISTLTPEKVSAERTIQNMNRLMAAWNAHDVERAAALYTPDYEGIDVGDAVPAYGPEGARQMLRRYFEAFPDLHFTLEDLLAQEERVAIVWTAQGTHRGAFMRIPPTGRPIMVRGVSVLTFREGQVARALYFWDVAGLLRDMRLLPEL